MSNDRDYEVGKGKPPKEHQFQPGRSGNPQGARRHRRNKRFSTLRDLAIECVNEAVNVTLNGRQIKVTKKEAITLAIINDALTGTPAHRLRALRELREIGAFDPAPQPRTNAQEINKFLEKLAEEHKRSLECDRIQSQ